MLRKHALEHAIMKPRDMAEVSRFSVALRPRASPQSDARSAVGIRVQKDYAGDFQRAADGGGGGALQSMLSAFKAAHCAAAHLGVSGEIVLCPVQKRSRGAALFRCQRHGPLDRAAIPKGQCATFWLKIRL